MKELFAFLKESITKSNDGCGPDCGCQSVIGKAESNYKKSMFWFNIIFICIIGTFLGLHIARLLKWEQNNNIQKHITEWSEHIDITLTNQYALPTNCYITIKIKDNNLLSVQIHTIISENITRTNEYSLPENGYITVTLPKR